MILIPLLVTGVLAFMLATAALNALVLPRLDRRLAESPPPADAPLVSLLVPARDEALHIAATVRSLLAQSHHNLELIVLDDHSQDGTADLALAAGAGDPRLRVLPGRPLPPGWLGKNWACQQLAQAAGGRYLVFADADVRWGPEALAALLAELRHTKADLLTVWPTQHTKTWGERLVVPLMALTVVGYLPWPLVHHTPWPLFAAANGQCLAFRRRAYEQLGGHAAVAADILEDVTLARRTKSRQLRLRMVDGAGLIICRMYDSWAAVRSGYAKNILAGYGGWIALLILATLFHWLVFLGPWAWLTAGVWLAEPALGWPLWPLALIGLGVGVRALTAAVTRQRASDALLLPLSVLAMTIIAGQAIWWQWRHGGPSWKGRTYAPLAGAAPQDRP